VPALIGPTGIQSGFEVDEEEEFSKTWRVGLSGGVFNTNLEFDGASLDTIQFGLMAMACVYPVERFSVHFGAGALIDGSLTDGNASFAMSPGVVGSFGLDVAAMREAEDRPFITFSADFAVAWTRTKENAPGAKKQNYTALDGRITMVLGKTLSQGVTLYVKGQGLLGRVYWNLGGKSVDGDDKYHYSAGLGLRADCTRGIDFFFEAMPAGERMVSIGFGGSF